MIFIGVLLGLIIGMGAASAAYGSLLKNRHESPFLHEGKWEGPDLVGTVGKQRAVWRSRGGHPICEGTNHGPVRCEVGPGTAHADECVCGAKRYGVYGSWS